MGEWLFGSPAMLGWLAAAAAPWVIYFLHRPRRRQMAWGAMLFLQRVLAKERVRRRSEWLLLTLRMLAVAFIALAFADPRWTSAGGEPAGGRLQVLVLDDSFSMHAVQDQRSVWEEARWAARRLLEASNPGDRWQIILAADPPRIWFREPTVDALAVREALDAMSAGEARTDAVALLQAVKRVIDKEGERSRGEVRPEVHWLTDWQRTTWNAALLPEMADSLAALRAKAVNRVHSLASVEGNLAVTDITVRERLPTTEQSVTIAARVHNFAAEPRPATTVRLWINGEQAAEQALDLAANAAVDLRWERSFATAGVQRLMVEVVDPILETDNRRYALIDVRDAVRVLALEGTPGEARPFALALEPNPGPTARIRVERIAAESWGDRNFSDYELLLLADLPELSPALAGRLRDYVRAGGGLIVAPGEAARPANYNTFAKGTAPLLPAVLEEPREVALTTFDPREYRDPLVEIFRGRERSGLLTTPTWRHYRLRPLAESVTALAFTDGDPAVAYHAFGAGRVCLWAIPFSGRSRTNLPDGSSTPWTAFESWPSFPPLMQRQLIEATRAGRIPPEMLVGRPFEGAFPVSSVGSLEARRPDGSRLKLAAESQDGQVRTHFGDTNEAGVYEIVTGAESVAARFVVNVDPAESDLAQADSATIRSALGDTSASAAFGFSDSQQRLFRPAFAVAVFLLVAESWLARRLGRLSR